MLEVERGDSSREFRALELGAGTGLVSLTLAKWWESVSGFNKREQEVEGKAAVEAKGVDKAEFEDRGCSDGDGTEISTASSNSLDLGRRRSCTVVATDFHPSVLANLHRNIEANFDFPFSCARSQSHPLPSQWQSTPSCPPSSFALPIALAFPSSFGLGKARLAKLLDCLQNILPCGIERSFSRICKSQAALSSKPSILNPKIA